MVELVAQGYCTTWVGIALLSCQCNAVLSGALVLYLVHCFVVMKPVTPLRARVSAGLKPVTPLRGENVGFSGVEGAQWCRRFQRALMVGTQRCQWFQHRYVAVGCARKSSPCGAVSARQREKVRPARQKPPNFAAFGLAGRVFRENDAGVRLLGELFRARGLKCLLLGELRRAQCCRILIPGSCVSCRASAAYDAVRTWIADAIEAVARQQGVDIENPTWE